MTTAVAPGDRGLAAAAKVREHELRACQAEYARRRQRVAALEVALQQAREQLNAVHEWMRELAARADGIDPVRCQAAGRYLAWQMGVVRGGESRLRDAETTAEQSRAALLDCHRDLRALQRLLARHREQWLKETQRRAMRTLDELGAARRHQALRHKGITGEQPWQ